MKKRNKKFHTWKDKWKRKQKFNWKKISAFDRYYMVAKWCGDSVHKERRHEEKMTIKKIIAGNEEANFPTKKPRFNKSELYYW